MPEFPNRVIIELKFLDFHDGYMALGKHVEGELTSETEPHVVKTLGRGATPVEALTNLMEGITRHESLWPLPENIC